MTPLSAPSRGRANSLAVPTAARPRSFAFYGSGLGLEPFGDLADDGIPEPLQFVLNDRARLMLIPTTGFVWVTSNRPTVSPGTSECLLTITVPDGHVWQVLVLPSPPPTRL
ncbi:hypothetical protein, partial [Lapillicoccus sp.]|uniref:hypothetical protein n=1 Tax=Lapillicoccus sp. TaxID=1909287 RepID=UPI0025DFFE1C